MARIVMELPGRLAGLLTMQSLGQIERETNGESNVEGHGPLKKRKLPTNVTFVFPGGGTISHPQNSAMFVFVKANHFSTFAESFISALSTDCISFFVRFQAVNTPRRG